MITQSILHCTTFTQKKQQPNAAPYRVSKKMCISITKSNFPEVKRHLLAKLVPSKIPFFQVKLLIWCLPCRLNTLKEASLYKANNINQFSLLKGMKITKAL